MIKKYFLLIATVATTAFGAVDQRTALRSFAKLANRCDKSLRVSSDKGAIKAFLAMRKIYATNKLPFRLLDKLNDDEITKLYDNCIQKMTAGRPTGRRNATRNPVAQATIPQPDSLTDQLPPLPITGDELFQAVEGFTAAYDKHLLKETTLKRFFARLGIQTAIETAAMAANHGIDLLTCERNTNGTIKKIPKHIPAITDRVTAATGIKGKKLAGNIGVALTRIGAYGLVDEYLPKGINSYWKRCVELMVPVILAGALMTAMDKGNMKHLKKAFMVKALNRFALTRCQLPKNHALYPVANALAYVGPFTLFSQSAVQGYSEGKLFSLNTMGNMAVDGLSTMLICDAIPGGIDKAVPRKVPMLNPAHRRKVIKNVPRDIIRSVWGAINDAAFTGNN